MQPDEADAAHLWDMLEYAREAVRIASETDLSAYSRDRTLQLAMERALEIVGEAARKVSKEFRDTHPDIPWRRIIAHRHVLAHEYGDIRQERLWETATVHAPELIRFLERFVSESGPS